MKHQSAKQRIVYMDLEKLNRLNEEGCPACGKKFSLGDPVVLTCGPWSEGPKYVHVDEAVFDEKKNCYFEKKYYASMR
jgi:hypothetical protein